MSAEGSAFGADPSSGAPTLGGLRSVLLFREAFSPFLFAEASEVPPTGSWGSAAGPSDVLPLPPGERSATAAASLERGISLVSATLCCPPMPPRTLLLGPSLLAPSSLAGVASFASFARIDRKRKHRKKRPKKKKRLCGEGRRVSLKGLRR